jgi:hypothetical protein
MGFNNLRSSNALRTRGEFYEARSCSPVGLESTGVTMRFPAWILAIAAPAVLAQGMTPSYQGLWWNSPPASESGWGLNIAHQGDLLFATWFTYDSSGRGMWLVLPGAQRFDEPDGDPYGYGGTVPEYRGTLYRTTGPAFDSATFDPAAVTVTGVGSAALRFSSANLGTFSYTVGGISQTKPIVRQAFATLPSCELGGPAGSTPNFQDLWWRSPAGSESGWGVNVTHQGDTIFATWFTYGADGRGMWLVMSDGRRTASNTYTGALYRTTGPAFDTMPWNPGQVAVTQAGTGTFTFSDANNGTFAYTVDGTSQSKPITRQVFSSPASVCR